jgi:hypothetical protein
MFKTDCFLNSYDQNFRVRLLLVRNYVIRISDEMHQCHHREVVVIFAIFCHCYIRMCINNNVTFEASEM